MPKAVNQITVQDLYANHSAELNLEWIAGQQGGKRSIVPETSKEDNPIIVDDDLDSPQKIKPSQSSTLVNKSLVGHLNLIHPHQIQVIGNIELKYFKGLREISRQDAIGRLIEHEPACIIIAEDGAMPMLLKRKCDENNIPLFNSPSSSNKITDSLHYYLTTLFADVLTLHGVFMEVNGMGVLITGPSGVGKSELALELVTRGHRLIADDAPQFSRIAPDISNGSCPAALQDFLEVRGLGIINVRELFGAGAIKTNKYLRLIMHLEPLDKKNILQIDRLEGSYRAQRILDLDIPEITLPVAPGRNLAVLLESATRNHILRISGYNAAEEFSERQRILIEQGS